MAVLSHSEAEAFYDRFGRRQDSQGFYEDVALEELIAHARFAEARDVLEVGCGTGRLADRLLREALPRDARYQAIDVSSTMVALAREKLSPFGPRVSVEKTDGSLDLEYRDESFDRVVSTFVADLLSDDDIAMMLEEAWRVLRPGGFLACAGLTKGERSLSRIVTTLWTALHRLRPSLVGGCRPVTLASRLPTSHWRMRHRSVVSAFGIPSEVLVAEKLGTERGPATGSR